jgi:hypothetical protein
MDQSESQVHSFIVKLWLEEPGNKAERLLWRGYVTHVPSGQRRYLNDLQDIVRFVESYVSETGGKSSQHRNWLQRWMRMK